MSNYKERLVRKWEAAKGPMSIKAIEDPYIKENLAQLLENQEVKDFSGSTMFSESGAYASDGATSDGSLDGAYGSYPQTAGNGGPSNWKGGDWKFRPVALALQRRTFPDLFANKVVGVQAMSTPVGLAYALRFTYNKNGFGPEAAWDVVPQYAGYSGNPGTSAALQNYTGLAATSGAVYGSSGTGLLTSAGEFAQIADSRSSCGTSGINQTAPIGAYGAGSGIGCGVEREWNQLGLRIDQQAIEALTRKLAASFSLEAAQDIKAMHGVDIEREMVNVLQYEITAELDRELLSSLYSAATNVTIGGGQIPAIDVTAGDNFGRWNGERYMSVISAIIYQANQIAIYTRRGPGNFVVVSPDIATALQAAGHQFVNYTQNVNPNTTMAAIGKLNGTLDVYRDQYATSSYALVGYKGPGVSDAGVIFSPYIMGLQNRAISPDDFSPRVGVMSRYAITNSLLGAGRYYRLIPFMNVANLIPGAGTGTITY